MILKYIVLFPNKKISSHDNMVALCHYALHEKRKVGFDFRSERSGGAMHELNWHLTLEGVVSPSPHTLLKEEAFKLGSRRGESVGTKTGSDTFFPSRDDK
jgi:hypothetical protein